MFLFPTVRNEVAPDEQVQRMLFLHNVNFVISFAQFAHVSPLFNHTPSIKGASSIEVGEKRQPWRSKFPISVPTAPKNPIRTQRPVSRETKYLALHPDNPLFCCMTTQLLVVKTKISAFLQLFCDCGLLSLICKAEGDCSTTDLLRFWAAIYAFAPYDNP